MSNEWAGIGPNPVVIAVPVAVVFGLIVLCMIAQCIRRAHIASEFQSHAATTLPRYDRPGDRTQHYSVYDQPYYPVSASGALAPARPQPVVPSDQVRTPFTPPITVPVSNAPTITPYIPDTDSIRGRQDVIHGQSLDSTGHNNAAGSAPPTYDSVWR